ncbi:MAG: sigma 54-interacting transcriptional regulator, partial [Chitinispirillia bacterium]
MINTKYPVLPIMLVDDELEALKVVELSLRQEGITNIIKCQKSSEVTRLLSNQNFSVIVLDLTMPEISGQELIPIIVRDYPRSVILVLTAVNDVETAVSCMKAGAFDYLVKPIDKNTLVLHMKRAIKHSELQKEMEALKESFLTDNLKKPEAFSSIITKNQKMLNIFKYLEAVANTNLTILITGDTGVGKELFAESIHILSERKGKFIPVNVAGLDDIMFSDTLFGHKKGAYTGADMSRKGLIEQAEGGTLFLDEVGDLSHASQIKLLRLLQD